MSQVVMQVCFYHFCRKDFLLVKQLIVLESASRIGKQENWGDRNHHRGFISILVHTLYSHNYSLSLPVWVLIWLKGIANGRGTSRITSVLFARYEEINLIVHIPRDTWLNWNLIINMNCIIVTLPIVLPENFERFHRKMPSNRWICLMNRSYERAFSMFGLNRLLFERYAICKLSCPEA